LHPVAPAHLGLARVQRGGGGTPVRQRWPRALHGTPRCPLHASHEATPAARSVKPRHEPKPGRSESRKSRAGPATRRGMPRLPRQRLRYSSWSPCASGLRCVTLQPRSWGGPTLIQRGSASAVPQRQARVVTEVAHRGCSPPVGWSRTPPALREGACGKLCKFLVHTYIRACVTTRSSLSAHPMATLRGKKSS